jgi:hypothetical protein
LAEVDLKLLETAGFIVIPQFLTADEVELLVTEYNRVKAGKAHDPVKNKNASVSVGLVPTGLKDKIANFLTQVNLLTDLSANYVLPGVTYFDNRRVKYNWHQDHDTYYMWQNSYNFLNFWIPIVKPQHDQSGISVIPFDVIMPLIPKLAQQRLIGHGAKKFPTKTNTTVMRDDSVGDYISLDINIEEFKQTPSMAAGDLLLMRGDVIHKTENSLTRRVAVSIRVCDADYALSKAVFYTQCAYKKLYIDNDPKAYEAFHKQFVSRDFVALGEIFKSWD